MTYTENDIYQIKMDVHRSEFDSIYLLQTGNTFELLFVPDCKEVGKRQSVRVDKLKPLAELFKAVQRWLDDWDDTDYYDSDDDCTTLAGRVARSHRIAVERTKPTSVKSWSDKKYMAFTERRMRYRLRLDKSFALCKCKYQKPEQSSHYFSVR